MANQLTGNPLVLDTPGTGVLITRHLHIYLIRWVSPSAAAGHAVLVKDLNGNIKWETVAPGANYVEADHIEDKTGWQGLDLTTLTSGRLYLYQH